MFLPVLGPPMSLVSSKSRSVFGLDEDLEGVTVLVSIRFLGSKILRDFDLVVGIPESYESVTLFSLDAKIILFRIVVA